MIPRRPSRRIMVGSVAVGGGAPISIQSMTNTPTADAAATLGQIGRLAALGLAAASSILGGGRAYDYWIAADRRAHFACAIALIAPDGTVRHFEGRCDGHIAEAPSGEGGFGYDPLFIPDGYDRSFAELAPAEKNAISHRGRALAALGAELSQLAN